MEGLEITLGGLRLNTPLMAVSDADGPEPGVPVPYLSAVITPSVFLHPQSAAPEPRRASTRAGTLSAAGLSNPGIAAFVSAELPILRAAETAVIASIAGSEIDEYVQCAEILNGRAEVHAVEVNASCPNAADGTDFGCDGDVLEELVTRVKKAVPGKTLAVRLTTGVTDIAAMAQRAVNGGANALTLVNALSGMAINPETRRPALDGTITKLSGAGIHPVAVYSVYKCYTSCCRRNNVGIIAVDDGIGAEEAIELILAGATCLGIGGAALRDPGISGMIANGIQAYLKRKGIQRVTDMIGKAAG